jgi:hypothetical protein
MQEEKYGTRDRTYSAWHRRFSTRRFIGIEQAQLLAMIDLDMSLYVEYDDSSKEPLVLCETARDVGQYIKPATVTKKLARRSGLRAYVLLYTLSQEHNPADSGCFDISKFRVRRIWPEPETVWKEFTPDEWAKELIKIRAYCAHQLDEEFSKKSAETHTQ